MISIGLRLLSNEVIAKICCRLKFSAAMASRFVEADEEFIEELRNTSENKNTKRSTEVFFPNFVKTLKICVKLILNCPRAHAITYTKHTAKIDMNRRNATTTHYHILFDQRKKIVQPG